MRRGLAIGWAAGMRVGLREGREVQGMGIGGLGRWRGIWRRFLGWFGLVGRVSLKLFVFVSLVGGDYCD